MTRINRHVTLAVCAFGLALAGCSDEKTDDAAAKIEVLDPAEEHFGMSYAEWNTEWYKWIFGIQSEDCALPLDDATGEYCTTDQNADVFFLAGSLGAEEVVVERDACVAPADKPIFFPIMNTVSDNGGVPEDSQLTEEQLQEVATTNLEKGENLFAIVDGEELTDLERFKTDIVAFSYTLPEEPNFYSCLGASGVTGTIDPSYAGGYYVMLAPLGKGSHEIRFGFEQSDGLYSLDMTYNLTVE